VTSGDLNIWCESPKIHKCTLPTLCISGFGLKNLRRPQETHGGSGVSSGIKRIKASGLWTR
jgi:hypothetical protein